MGAGSGAGAGLILSNLSGLREALVPALKSLLERRLIGLRVSCAADGGSGFQYAMRLMAHRTNSRVLRGVLRCMGMGTTGMGTTGATGGDGGIGPAGGPSGAAPHSP